MCGRQRLTLAERLARCLLSSYCTSEAATERFTRSLQPKPIRVSKSRRCSSLRSQCTRGETTFVEMVRMMEGYGFRFERPVGWLSAPGTG